MAPIWLSASPAPGRGEGFDTLTALGVIGAVLILACGAVLALMETAVASLSKARVESFVREERPGAARLNRVMERRADHINLLVLLRTSCEVSGAVVVSAVFVDVLGTRSWAFIAATVVVTLVTFILIGVVSRTLGRQNPYTVSLTLAPLMLGLNRIFGFIAKSLVWAGSVVSPGRGFRDGPFASEIELREMVDIASERGIVENDERRMIQSVFDLTSTTARSVMVPRPEMIWIESHKSAGQATSLCVRSGLSRLPVMGEDADDVVGIVYLKDLVARTYHSSDAGRSVPVTDVMRQAVFVPDSRLLADLLEDMQRDQNHLAMLVDEYGAIAGLITIEDILEEIVGEISDEYDADEEAPIEALGDGKFRILTRVSLDEVEELFNDPEFPESMTPAGQRQRIYFSDEQHAEVDTIAGLAAFELGKVPLPGAEVHTAGLEFVFEGGRDRRGRYKVRSAIVRQETRGQEARGQEASNSEALAASAPHSESAAATAAEFTPHTADTQTADASRRLRENHAAEPPADTSAAATPMPPAVEKEEEDD